MSLKQYSKMETFDIEQKGAVPIKKGLFITYTILAVIGVVTALVFAGSIIATYFGKSCPQCENRELAALCGDYYCSNTNIFQGKITINIIKTGLSFHLKTLYKIKK